jgi:hypothetical protein
MSGTGNGSRTGKPGTPARRDRTRPVELIALAAGFGIFSGLVVGFATREWILAAEFFGVIFIVSLVVLAMLVLGQPKPDDPAKPGQPGQPGDDDMPLGH